MMRTPEVGCCDEDTLARESADEMLNDVKPPTMPVN